MKKLIFLSLLFFTTSFLGSQNPLYGQLNGNSLNIHESIRLTTDKIFDRLVQIRRNLHENPELSGKEKNTQAFIKKHLLDLGLEVETGIYGYGVVGILKGGKKGKKIAWRADMDALPNDFPEKVDFKSKTKGVQHGCGHDIHMTVALGIAEVLAKNKELLHGTVYFIFQPEEETFEGAKKMIEHGLFSTINPDEIYGLHVTAMAAGQIMVKPNEIFAYQRRIRIALKNDLTTGEVIELTKKIESSLFRTQENSKPWDLQLVVDPNLGMGSPNTIYKDYLIPERFGRYTRNDTLFIESNLYETNAQNLNNILPTIMQTIKANGFNDKLLSVSFIRNPPNVINDEKLTDVAINTLSSIYGEGLVIKGYGMVPFFNDDFAYFQEKIKGVYFFLGGSNFEKGIIAMNHSPNFEVDEKCISTGVKSFSSLIVERLK